MSDGFLEMPEMTNSSFNFIVKVVREIQKEERKLFKLLLSVFEVEPKSHIKICNIVVFSNTMLSNFHFVSKYFHSKKTRL